MIATPNISHLSKEDFLKVYEPAEDTFCLLDALENDIEQLQQAKIRLVVEIGSGSGCVSTFVGQIVGNSNSAYLCTDINEAALKATLATGKANQVHLLPIQSHLVDALYSRCKNKIDLLIFNPPYVPTIQDEEVVAQQDRSLAGSWAGGINGITLLEGLLPQIKDLLSEGGSFYLVAIHQNNPMSIVELLKQSGLKASICLSRRAGGEHLYIIRATKLSATIML